MRKISIILLAASLCLATGCEKFLSEKPTRSTNDPIERLEQLDVLLNTTTMPNDIQSRWSTDDAEVPFDLFNASPSNFSVSTMCYYIFDMEAIENQASDAFWQGIWSIILRANTIINFVDQVTGSDTDKANLKAEAHFIRAFYMWELANAYCMPYAEENFESPGLPLRQGTSFEEGISRASLKATYEFIEKDIEEALKVEANAVEHRFRPTKASINAFLSRYYLHTGDYEKALMAADYALENGGSKVRIKDYNEIVAGTPQTFSDPDAVINYPEWNDFSSAQYYDWQEFFFLRLCYTSGQWFVPSTNLMAMFEETGELDMRFKWFFLNYGNRRMGINTPDTYRYMHFDDGRYIMSGPTVQEVMLNKAEALVRKSSPDVPGAISLINDLRVNRIDPSYAELNVSASTQQEALRLILEERRRELPFAHRWWDIRRFAFNETTADDVVVTHTFHPIENGVWNTGKTETFTLPVKSKKYALPLNGMEIDSSEGQLVQNSYE